MRCALAAILYFPIVLLASVSWPDIRINMFSKRLGRAVGLSMAVLASSTDALSIKPPTTDFAVVSGKTVGYLPVQGNMDCVYYTPLTFGSTEVRHP